jgi:hypothetical protein
MAADIYLTNLNPNQKWFANISALDSESFAESYDSVDEAIIELYNTEANALARTNRVAHGVFNFGTAVRVILVNDYEDPDIELFNLQNSWHLRVTFNVGDDDAIIEFGPMTDIDDVIDSLLVTDVMCEDRARLEIDRATHLKITRQIPLATHIQELECLPTGDKRNLKDNMRNLDQQVRVDEIKIHGDKNSLTDILTVVEFEDLER